MSTADVDQLIQQARAAADRDKQDAAMQAAKQYDTLRQQQDNPIAQWVVDLPRNITVGLMDAAVNMVDAAGSFVKAAAKNFEGPPAAAQIANEQNGLTPNGETMQDLRLKALNADKHPTQGFYGRARQAVLGVRDELAGGSNTADQITQSAAQFAVPFLGWSRLLGAEKLLSFGNLAAESMTSGTAFEPHGTRMADLVSLAKHSEGKFADLMNTITPDGSLLNQYIDYMTDRNGETEAEGRFKNVIDNLALTGATAALLKAGATALKVGVRLPGYIAENAGVPRVGPAAQEGKIVFHGTPHDFERFDASAIGSGEGAQVYGHGLYFAEEPGVARSYTQAGGPYLSFNGERVHAEEWDGEPVKGPVKDLLIAGNDRGLTTNAARSWAAEQITKTPEQWGLKSREEQLRALDMLRQTRLTNGQFMHVDIPDEKISQMLDHDKLMREQPDVLDSIPEEDQIGIQRMLDDHNQDGELQDFTGNQFYQLIQRAINEGYIDFTPRDGSFDNPKKVASEYLGDHGVPGIKYLDEKSRKPRLFLGAEPYAPQGYAEEHALNLVRQAGSVKRAVNKAERLGWNKPDAFYQDREKYAALKGLQEKGVEYKAEGTRNIVLFNARDARIVKKEKPGA